jgi:hypothetical protein
LEKQLLVGGKILHDPICCGGRFYDMDHSPFSGLPPADLYVPTVGINGDKFRMPSVSFNSLEKV